MKSPVKWVVRTTELDILVTKAFCNPIAKSSIQAVIFWGIPPIAKVFNPHTDNNKKHSNRVGARYLLCLR